MCKTGYCDQPEPWGLPLLCWRWNCICREFCRLRWCKRWMGPRCQHFQCQSNLGISELASQYNRHHSTAGKYCKHTIICPGQYLRWLRVLHLYCLLPMSAVQMKALLLLEG